METSGEQREGRGAGYRGPVGYGRERKKRGEKAPKTDREKDKRKVCEEIEMKARGEIKEADHGVRGLPWVFFLQSG